MIIQLNNLAKNLLLGLLFVTAVFIFAQCNSKKQMEISKLLVEKTNITEISSQSKGKKMKGTIVIIETTKGVIKAELADEDAPKTAGNFKNLVKKNFYNGLTFHRVEKDFVIQGGDPLGNGTGGSGTEIPLEIKCKDGRTITGELAPADCDPVLQHTKGALSMARSQDPNSASSQFFIMLSDKHFLDRSYAAFGYVIEGQDVVDKIEVGDKMTKVSIEE